MGFFGRIGNAFASGAKAIGKGVTTGAKVIGKGVATGAKVVGKGVQKGATALANSEVAEKMANIMPGVGAGMMAIAPLLASTGVGAPLATALGTAGALVSAGGAGLKGIQHFTRATSRKDLGELKNAGEALMDAKGQYNKAPSLKK